MYARIATFDIPEDTPPEVGERIVAGVRRRITEEGGPAGAQRVMLLVAPPRRRALNITLFDSQESMQAAEPFFDAMKPMDPERSGRRIDVGHYQIVLDEPVAATASS